jgi:peptidoglycan biosynthesis protein MviN/MurJ (putative lipid II flippase)
MYELTIPTWGQIIPLQLARSGLFLITCLPFAIWQRSAQKPHDGSELRRLRVKLWLALGLALFILTAFMAVITAYWFPWQLRLFHGLELLATALLYAGVFVRLFLPQSESKTWAMACRRSIG